jgi:hypothetical protein
MESNETSMAADMEADGGDEVKLGESEISTSGNGNNDGGRRIQLPDDHVRLLLPMELRGDEGQVFKNGIRRQWCERGYVEMVGKCPAAEDKEFGSDTDSDADVRG